MLDVGSGWGAVTGSLGEWGEVTGVEPEPVARQEAARRGIRVVDGRAEELPAEDESMGLVIASDVIEHLPDDVAAVRELTRVLRPGGLALITVPANPWLMGAHDRASGHYRRYTRETLAGALEAGGLRLDRMTHFNSLLFPIAVPVRLLGRRREPKADVPRAPGPLDAIFYRLFRSERGLLRRFDLPFGLSLAALATRPAAGAQSSRPAAVPAEASS